MEQLLSNLAATISPISIVTDGKGIVAAYFSYRWLLELAIRQGQVVEKSGEWLDAAE